LVFVQKIQKTKPSTRGEMPQLPTQYFNKIRNNVETSMDLYMSGAINGEKKLEAKRAVILLNGVGQQACHWPSELVAKLEEYCSVARMDYRGLLTPEYVPTTKDLLRDVAHARSALIEQSVLGDSFDIFVLGYSFGGISTQLVLSDPGLRDLFKGFVLVATGSEFIPEAFARSYVGPGAPPVDSVNLIKTVFSPRFVPAGETALFIDGRPNAWTVIKKPDLGPLAIDWSEGLLEYFPRKLAWLVPAQSRFSFLGGRALREYVQCPKTPEHFTPKYVDFASSLMMDERTGKPGRGELFARLRNVPTDAGIGQRVMVVTGSQDGLFPLEHFCRLVKEMQRIFSDTTAVVYEGKHELLPLVHELESKNNKHRVVHVDIEAGGHALLFQDHIVHHFADLVVAWIIKKQ
jgi:pimeloyl-ACP methyl ester carboxylesterase